MKYNILGFYQPRAIELGLESNDLLVLRWFVDYAGTNKMRTMIIDNKIYYWINYSSVLEELPILIITKKTLARKHFGTLVKANVLEHKHITEGGSFSCYCYGINYDTLIYLQNDNGGCVKNNDPMSKNTQGGASKNTEQINNILNINNKENIIINNNTKEKSIKEQISEQPKELQSVLEKFIEMRKKIKKPMTDYAFKLLLNKLEKLSKGFLGNKVIILNQSIVNCWQDIYEFNGKFSDYNPELVDYAKELAGEKGDKYALAILHNWKKQNINDLEVAKKSTELFIKGVGNQNKDNFILHERKYTKDDFDSIVCDIDEIDI